MARSKEDLSDALDTSAAYWVTLFAEPTSSPVTSLPASCWRDGGGARGREADDDEAPDGSRHRTGDLIGAR